MASGGARRGAGRLALPPAARRPRFVSVTAKVPPALADRLAAAAFRRGTTSSRLLRRLLEEFLDGKRP